MSQNLYDIRSSSEFFFPAMKSGKDDDDIVDADFEEVKKSDK